MLARLLMLLATPAAAKWPSGGVGECPGIDPFARGVLLNNHTPRAAIAGCDWERSSGRVCFPASYGASSCTTHDAETSPECMVGDPPNWCTDHWCFVDPDDCDRPFAQSAYFGSATLPPAGAEANATTCAPVGAPLAFSYQTCGYIDSFSTSGDGLANVLRKFAVSTPGGKLRVAFPGDSSSKYTLVSYPARYPACVTPGCEKGGQFKVTQGGGVQGTNRSGAVVVFMANLFARYKVPWVEVPISQRSRDFSTTSSFTACVHDVAIGNVDMCWANFWPTSSRRRMASFTATMYNDQFFVIVPLSGGATTFWSTMLKPFAPFTWDLWLVIIVVFAFVGVTLTVENQEGKINWWDFLCTELPTAVLRGLNAYNLGEVPEVRLSTSGSWLTAFFVGFTFQVLITGYTAVVTTTLMEQGATEITTLRDGMDRGFTFCANADMVPGLISLYPALAQLIVNSPRGGSLAAMDNGVCYGALVHEDYWRAERLFGERSQCNTKARLAETVTVVPNAIPVRGEIERVLSSMIASDVEAGEFTRQRNLAILNYTYDKCAEQSTTTSRRQFTLGDLSGPMVLLIVTSFVSVLLTRIGKALKRRSEQLKRQLDKDGDGVITRVEIASAVAEKRNSLRLRGSHSAEPPAALAATSATASAEADGGAGEHASSI